MIKCAKSNMLFKINLVQSLNILFLSRMSIRKLSTRQLVPSLDFGASSTFFYCLVW